MPMKMEWVVSSETSALKAQTLGDYLKDTIWHQIIYFVLERNLVRICAHALVILLGFLTPFSTLPLYV